MFKLQEPLEKLSDYLTQDYGGKMENLWIDLELSLIEAQIRAPFSFRFQKRVSGKSKIISGVQFPDSFNVGHYGVHPDFKELLATPDPIKYILNLIYASTVILLENKKKLTGFNVEKFRIEFLKGCLELGYEIPS